MNSSSVQLIGQNQETLQQVDLSEVEPISGSTFQALLEENDQLLIARVQTRDKSDFRKKYFHMFYGPNLIKILFQVLTIPPNGQVLRSRYHNEFPLTAKNPLTNEVIVGEVHFFLLQPGETQATFFGTDFNYASSKQFREEFNTLTKDRELCDLGFHQDAQLNQQENGRRVLGGNQIENDNQTFSANETAYQQFMTHLQAQAALGFDIPQVLTIGLMQRARALEFYGKVLCFFIIATTMTVYTAVKNFYLSANVNHMVELDLFTYILPFVSFIIDASVKKAYHIQAKPVFLGFKIIFIFYYLAVYVCALQQTSDSLFYWLVNTNLLLFPTVMSAYWFLLVKGKLS